MRRLRGLFVNFLTPKMHASSVILSIVSILLLLLTLGGQYWIRQASSQTVDQQVVMPDPYIKDSGSDESENPIRHEVDAVLVIDFSGSMYGAEGSDPTQLRLSAAELMSSSLAADIYPRKTRMGYILFGSQARVIKPLISVEDPNARQELIKDIYSPIQDFEQLSKYTNISGALKLAKDTLIQAPQEQGNTKNTPAIIFLTDGEPTTGQTDESSIKAVVQDLKGNGITLFIILLRNPRVEERPELTRWRIAWNDIANSFPTSVEYAEAQNDTQLEEIYNTIRGRLINEGTRPGQRTLYDPTDPNSAIQMPPNLLKANLLLGKPGGTGVVDLVDPDGKTFKQMLSENPRDSLLDGHMYYRFTIDHPKPGPWTLQTEAKQPIYFLLNSESLYSANVAWPTKTPYISADVPTRLPIVIRDTNERVINQPFHLNAAILRNENDPNGAIVEKSVDLPAPELQPDGQTYLVDISPNLIGNNEIVTLQVDGESDDGSLVNVSYNKLPVALVPSSVHLSVSPKSVVCDTNHIQFWPPGVDCKNMITASIQVNGSERLQSGTLEGELYNSASSPIKMHTMNDKTLDATFGPLTQPGNYAIGAVVTGKTPNGIEWQGRANEVVQVGWPDWMERWREGLKYIAGYLIILALWKPIIVGLLLPLFNILGMAPRGYYKSDLSDSKGNPGRIYDRAMLRRKLFTLTIALESKRDIPAFETTVLPYVYGGRFGKVKEAIRKWLRTQPAGRLVAMPFGQGIYYETSEGFRQAPNRLPANVRVGNTAVQVCQKDWIDVN